MLYFVSIFKTNISTEIDKAKVMQKIQSLHGDLDVHVDLEDDEKIMRVAAVENVSKAVKALLQESYYSCEELDCFYRGNSIYSS